MGRTSLRPAGLSLASRDISSATTRSVSSKRIFVTGEMIAATGVTRTHGMLAGHRRFPALVGNGNVLGSRNDVLIFQLWYVFMIIF